MATPPNDKKEVVNVKAPTYNELFTLVNQLRAKIDAGSADPALIDGFTKLKSVFGQTDETSGNPLQGQEQLEYRVIPDLTKGADKFKG